MGLSDAPGSGAESLMLERGVLHGLHLLNGGLFGNCNGDGRVFPVLCVTWLYLYVPGPASSAPLFELMFGVSIVASPSSP